MTPPSPVPATIDPFQLWLIASLTELRQQLAGVEEQNKGLYKTLMGNGQPGKIQELEVADAALAARAGNTEGKIEKINSKIVWLVGVGSGLSFAAAVISFFLRHI